MITKKYYKSREEWLALRKEIPALGGSEVGSILGLNPYEGAYSVWARRKGLAPEKPDTEAMRQGRDLEDYVAERFCELSGMGVHKVNAILQNADFPHLQASIDRKVANQDAGLECKTASALREKAFKGGVFPASYYAQCVTYLVVSELKTWFLAVLVLGKEFKVFAITRDPEFVKPEWCESVTYVDDGEVEALSQAVEDFWTRCMDGNDAPPVDGSEASKQVLAGMPHDNETVCDLTSMDETLQTLKTVSEQIKALELVKAQNEQAIQQFMGDARTGSSRYAKASWVTMTRKSLDQKGLAAEVGEDVIEKYTSEKTSNSFRIKFN